MRKVGHDHGDIGVLKRAAKAFFTFAQLSCGDVVAIR
jgi:hypothetical protein